MTRTTSNPSFWKFGVLLTLLSACGAYAPGAECTEERVYRQARSGLPFPAACVADRAALEQAYAFGRKYWELDREMWRLRRQARGDQVMGQRVSRSAEYNALRRERSKYTRWPP